MQENEIEDLPVTHEELQHYLRVVLNNKYMIWHMTEIRCIKNKIKNPLVKVSKDIFQISDKAKIEFDGLCKNEFFEFYEWEKKAFISNKMELKLVFDDDSSIDAECGRIYLHVSGEMFYSSRMCEISERYPNLISLDRFIIGNLTKAAR